jgi:hypothetical protein
MFELHKRRILNRLDQELAPMSRGSIEATEDRGAVTAAVLRGASAPHSPEPAPDLSQMSDAEFRAYKRQFGFD